MGRTKVPTVLALARGNPSKNTYGEDEAKPDVLNLDGLMPPSSLSPKAKKVWTNIVKHLHKCGLYTVADEQTLMTYCESFAEWRYAQNKVWAEGQVINRQDEEGNDLFPRISPWVKVSNDAFNRMAKLIPQLGLSPAARSGLNVKPPKSKVGDFDDF